MSERVRPSRSRDKDGAESVASGNEPLRSPVTVRRYAGVTGDNYSRRNTDDIEGEQELQQIFSACGHQDFPKAATPVQLSLAAQLELMRRR